MAAILEKERNGSVKTFKKLTALMLCMVMLASVFLTSVSAQNEIDVDAVSNGNHNSLTYDKGIFSAVASGSGLFAVALYKDDELVKISFSESEEDVTRRLNMLIEETAGTTMKIFRFDTDGNPIALNKNLVPKEKNYDVYINETFDNGAVLIGAQPDGSTSVLSDGRMYVTTKLGPIPIRNPKKNIIIEADFELPEGQDWLSANLISIHNNGVQKLVKTNGNGISYGRAGGNPIIKKVSEINRKFNIAVKIDFETKKYEIYYNKSERLGEFDLESAHLKGDIEKNGFGIFVPQGIPTGKALYVDNIRAYSGTDFIDIGNDRPNSHYHSFKDVSVNSSGIYERPEAEYIMKEVLDSPRPRLIINRARVNEIKNSNDLKIIEMKQKVLEEANRYLSMESFKYPTATSGSLSNVSDALDMMFNLGMAYLITDDESDKEEYVKRAYKEAEVLFNVIGYGVEDANKEGTGKTPEGKPDYWNSYTWLDISEISTIMAICYDWMYDGLTPSQRAELEKHTLEKGILRSYKGIYSEYDPTSVNPPNKFGYTNNWGAVCNGGILMASIAFMEADPYMCSQMAEANIRAIEYMLPSFLPNGAWPEGVGYWGYTLKFLSYMCSTLDSVFGNDFGITKAQGLKETQYFSIASEGKVTLANFSDAGSERINTPYLFYWAKKFNNKEIGGLAKYIKDQFKYDYSIYDLLYYDKAYVNDDNYIKPQFFYFSGDQVEQVTMDNNASSDGIFVAMTGGKGTASNHDHIDSGSIIVDIGGERLIRDAGAEHYGVPKYFSTNRYFYYKTRPEGHNIFVINPANLYDTDGTTYYHGQSETAESKVVESSREQKWAKIDLSAAYARDAKSASRKISFSEDNNKLIIDDEITLKSDGSLVEWYYHYRDILTFLHTYKGSEHTRYKNIAFGENNNGEGRYCTVTKDGNNAYKITYRSYTYENDGTEYGDNAITMGNTYKTFRISFESSNDFELEIRDSVRNPYDASILESFRKEGTFGKDYNTFNYSKYGSYPLNKVTAVMKNASGTVKLRTIIEYVGSEER